VFDETLCGLHILSVVGQVLKNKQNLLANICFNDLVLLFVFHLCVGCGKMHLNPNGDKGDGFAIQHFSVTDFFFFSPSKQPHI